MVPQNTACDMRLFQKLSGRAGQHDDDGASSGCLAFLLLPSYLRVAPITEAIGVHIIPQGLGCHAGDACRSDDGPTGTGQDSWLGLLIAAVGHLPWCRAASGLLTHSADRWQSRAWAWAAA